MPEGIRGAITDKVSARPNEVLESLAQRQRSLGRLQENALLATSADRSRLRRGLNAATSPGCHRASGSKVLLGDTRLATHKRDQRKMLTLGREIAFVKQTA